MRLSPRAPESRNAREIALALLARREYSQRELQLKLISRGVEASAIGALLEELAAERLQSDARFTENYVNARHARGFGPLRIRLELQQRGVDESLIDAHLDACEGAWEDLMRAQYHKRFGDRPAEDFAERARRGRFLQQRGFSSERIGRLLHELCKGV
ncbi:MAG: regulatory protein RecX [Gammaproteobacteria bacterium]